MAKKSSRKKKQYNRKPLSLAEYTRLSDATYSLMLGQGTAARGEEKASWASVHGRCVIINMLAALLLKQRYADRFKHIHLRRVVYCAHLTHPQMGEGSSIIWWGGNPRELARGSLAPEAAAALPDVPGAFHVAVIAEDKRGRKWLIDITAPEAFHHAMVCGDITRPDPASEYALAVCPIREPRAKPGDVLKALLIDDVPLDVRDYAYRDLTMDLCQGLAVWWQPPSKQMSAMAAVDERGAYSITEFQPGAYWRNADKDLPDNIIHYGTVVEGEL